MALPPGDERVNTRAGPAPTGAQYGPISRRRSGWSRLTTGAASMPTSARRSRRTTETSNRARSPPRPPGLTQAGSGPRPARFAVRGSGGSDDYGGAPGAGERRVPSGRPAPWVMKRGASGPSRERPGSGGDWDCPGGGGPPLRQSTCGGPHRLAGCTLACGAASSGCAGCARQGPAPRETASSAQAELNIRGAAAPPRPHRPGDGPAIWRPRRPHHHVVQAIL